MPRRLPVSPERLAQLTHLTSAEIATELGCTADHATVLLRRYGLSWKPAPHGRPAVPCSPAPPAPRRPSAPRRPGVSSVRVTLALSAGQQAVMKRYQAGGFSLAALAKLVGITASMLQRELLGVRVMPPERVAALATFFKAST